jgi:hypothetical protein
MSLSLTRPQAAPKTPAAPLGGTGSLLAAQGGNDQALLTELLEGAAFIGGFNGAPTDLSLSRSGDISKSRHLRHPQDTV